ncbi:DUF4839 domain-containing protein [Agromyces ramosus]|uniref:DUF4839 domain-containing protein n=1 Tax=Agromyces ramosus TaxID=33879 RepID=A0ABU0R5J0_9MICO|nr:DUF4839 domain-containing protein [Agromyces ramosus]MDQ0893346.1 hypothetical protein [Agromyces ramosus]
MVDEGITYETTSVRAIRGMEARTVAKWENQGWEVVSQTTGKLQTEIVIRRPKPKSRVLLYAIGAGALAIVLATVITIGVISDRNAPAAEADATPSAGAGEVSSSETEPSESVEPSEPAEPEDIVITTANNPDFAALLALGDYCDDSIPVFAEKYRGQTIVFDGNVGAVNNHDGATTRYDILIGAGDYSETSQPGPAFQFRDVNLVNDLHYVGDVPDTLGVGDNLNVTAEVGEYEPGSCLFLIEPVETTYR